MYISQDGDHPGVLRLIRGTGKDLMLGASAKGFQHWQHPRKPILGNQQACSSSSCNQCLIELLRTCLVEFARFLYRTCDLAGRKWTRNMVQVCQALSCGWHSPTCIRQCSHLQAGHAWLSQHYRWGLSRLFEEEGHTHAIILEDDMLFSPDFLTLFEVRQQRGTERDPLKIGADTSMYSPALVCTPHTGRWCSHMASPPARDESPVAAIAEPAVLLQAGDHAGLHMC